MTLPDLGPYRDDPEYAEAVALDEADELRHHRGNYIHTDPDLIYLDGNSLGRLPIGTQAAIEDVVDRQWGDRLIRSWNEGWWDLQVVIGDKLAQIVGARAGEVLISDSTSVNLYKLAMAAIQSTGGTRGRIVTDDLNFPTDIYVLDGVARACGGELVVIASDGIHGPVEALREAIDEKTALVSLSHTVFKSGYTYDMGAINDIARSVGAMTLWDCSHSAGAVPIQLDDSGTDLAVGCTYKYLNGGPGSPAFLYVRRRHQENLHNPITGWWGHDRPFDFTIDFEPTPGIRRFHAGTMPILSLAAVEPALDDILAAGVPAIRSKSVALTEYSITQWQAHLKPLGFALASPRKAERRGSHVSLRHDHAWPIARALIEDAGVIPDFRTPDNIRLGLSALYTRFVDVHTAIQRMKRVVEAGLHLRHLDDTATVT